MSKKAGGGSFCPNETNADLSKRVYYTSDRPITNFIARQWNRSSAKSHVAKQEYTL